MSDELFNKKDVLTFKDILEAKGHLGGQGYVSDSLDELSGQILDRKTKRLERIVDVEDECVFECEGQTYAYFLPRSKANPPEPKLRELQTFADLEKVGISVGRTVLEYRPISDKGDVYRCVMTWFAEKDLMQSPSFTLGHICKLAAEWRDKFEFRCEIPCPSFATSSTWTEWKRFEVENEQAHER